MTEEVKPINEDVTAAVEGDQSSTVDHSDLKTYRHFNPPEQQRAPDKSAKLKMPTLAQLLSSTFKDRQHLLFPWLREQESCMVYAETGVGKSMFALSAALAIAGGGEFLGWKPDERKGGDGWRVLYVDGEMHIADIQERARMLLTAVPSIDRVKAEANLRFLARQHQEPDTIFPSITEVAGTAFVLERVQRGQLDLVVLDNFSTLGEVEDENAASSFNAIQQFLLQLKVQGVATILVHHANKTGEDFRGSSKLAATFETIIRLEKPREEKSTNEAAEFRVCWQKVRAGGPRRTVRDVVARLTEEPPVEFGGQPQTSWMYEATELGVFDDLKIRLQDGEFINQKEVSDFYGKTKPTARAWLNKGIRIGLWTEPDLDRWFAYGNRRRDSKSTKPPVRPDSSWREEAGESEIPF